MSAPIAERVAVIDCDTHVIEPYDLWTSRMSLQKWGDLVPHVRWDEERAEDMWFMGDMPLTAIGMGAQANFAKPPPFHPTRWDEIEPELHDAELRLKRMDRDGVHAQLLYPNVPGFGAGNFSRADEPDFMLECIQAYNDYLTDWSSAAPRRLLPVSALPFWDLQASMREIERCASRGHVGVIFSQQPEAFGQPPLPSRHWDPLWATAQDAGMPVNFHIASGTFDSLPAPDPDTGPHANFSRLGSSLFMGNNRALLDLIFTGICHRFPRLDFVSVESGVGWMPFALESFDWQWLNSGGHKENPDYLLPSDYFKRQIYGCFWFERDSLVKAVEQLGPDNFLYETDFPHPTSMSPGVASEAQRPGDYIDDVLGQFPEDVAEKLLHGNAARVYLKDR